MTRKPIRSISTPRGLRALVAALDGPEANRLLETLLTVHPELLPEVAGLVDAELGNIAANGVADQVVSALEGLSIETVWERSGIRRNGDYLEPIEAAGLLVDETVAPFLADLARRMDLGRRGEATEVCKGTLLGVYRVGQADGEFLEGHAPDALEEVACRALEMWKKGRHGRGRPRASATEVQAMRRYVSEVLPEWSRFLKRGLGVVGRR